MKANHSESSSEHAFVTWLLGSSNIILGLILAGVAVAVATASFLGGQYWAMFSLSLSVASLVGLFFGLTSENKRTGFIAGLLSGTLVAGVFALGILIYGRSDSEFSKLMFLSSCTDGL